MNDTNQKLLDLVDAYRLATSERHSESYISRLALGSWDVIARLRADKGITTRRADRLVQWFADNWPKGGRWPKSLPRPPRSKDREAA